MYFHYEFSCPPDQSTCIIHQNMYSFEIFTETKYIILYVQNNLYFFFSHFSIIKLDAKYQIPYVFLTFCCRNLSRNFYFIHSCTKNILLINDIKCFNIFHHFNCSILFLKIEKRMRYYWFGFQTLHSVFLHLWNEFLPQK